MKKTALSLAIALLLLFSCSPAPEGGDGYIPVPGLSFGMSVEEAMEAVPKLELVKELLVPIPTQPGRRYIADGFITRRQFVILKCLKRET